MKIRPARDTGEAEGLLASAERLSEGHDEL